MCLWNFHGFAPIGPRLADEVKRAAELGFTPLVVCNGHAKVWKPIVSHGFLGQVAQTGMQDDHRSLILYLSLFFGLVFFSNLKSDLQTKRKHVGVIGAVFSSSFWVGFLWTGPSALLTFQESLLGGQCFSLAKNKGNVEPWLSNPTVRSGSRYLFHLRRLHTD